MRRTILIAHAEGEDALAEELAQPLRREGYEVVHRGTVFVGESISGEASKALNDGSPVVLCGTVKAIGTAWARRIVNAAKPFTGVRVFPVRMEPDAAIDEVVPAGTVVAEYWQAKERAIRELVAALQAYFPTESPKSSVDEKVLADYLTIVRGKYASLPDAYRGDAFRQLTDIYTTQFLEPQEKPDTGDARGEAKASRTGIQGATAATGIGKLTFEEALRAEDRHLLVEGGPGTGKSSLLRHFAHEQATHWLEKKSVKEFPLLVSAPNFCANLERPLSALLHTACTREFGAEWQNTALPSDIFDKPPAQDGRWLVLVDGLDTIAEVSTRERLLTAVRNRDPKGPYRFILTTRPITELGPRSSTAISFYRILPFDDDRLSDFARAWYKGEPQTARRFVEALSRTRLGDLARIPLLTTVAATLLEHQSEGLRGSRSSMYEQFVQLVLREKKDQWESAQVLLRRLETSWSNALGAKGEQLISEIFIVRRSLLELSSLRSFVYVHKPKMLTNQISTICARLLGRIDNVALKRWALFTVE